MAEILISGDRRKRCYSCLKLRRPLNKYDRAWCREGMAFPFRLESQQLRASKRHQSLDKFSDAGSDGRPPVDADPTVLRPFLRLALYPKQHLRSDILIEVQDML